MQILIDMTFTLLETRGPAVHRCTEHANGRSDLRRMRGRKWGRRGELTGRTDDPAGSGKFNHGMT